MAKAASNPLHLSPENFEAAVLARMEIQRGLGRVEGKIDQIIEGINAHEERDQHRFSDVNERVTDLNKRLLAAERKLWIWTGAIVIFAFVASHFPFSHFLPLLNK
jgi:hypothetical protein